MAKAPAGFPIDPPIEPMLSKLAEGLPEGDEWLFEPKWDGFRAIVFRAGDEVYIQSRDCRPLDRYFPELHTVFRQCLPPRVVLDGEIVIAGPRGLDFDAPPANFGEYRLTYRTGDMIAPRLQALEPLGRAGHH